MRVLHFGLAILFCASSLMAQNKPLHGIDITDIDRSASLCSRTRIGSVNTASSVLFVICRNSIRRLAARPVTPWCVRLVSDARSGEPLPSQDS